MSRKIRSRQTGCIEISSFKVVPDSSAYVQKVTIFKYVKKNLKLINFDKNDRTFRVLKKLFNFKNRKIHFFFSKYQFLIF